jgi:peptidyl-tRNA hydrolase
VRVRIGVSAERAKGRVKKFDVLSKFRPGEQAGINVAKKNVKDALKLLLSEGLEKAMGEIHAR